MKKIIKNKRVVYLTSVILLIIFSIALNIAFSAITSSNTKEVANIKVAGMSYNLQVNGVSGTKITINPNTTTLSNITLTADNEYASKYEITYKVCSTSACSSYIGKPAALTVEYSSKTIDGVTSNISVTGTKNIRLATTNTSGATYYIELFVNAGYEHNTLELEQLISTRYLEPDLVINLPASPSGKYNPNFAGALWNYKTSSLEVSSMTNSNGPQEVNLTNDSTSAVNLATFIKGLGTSKGVYNEPATDYRFEGKNVNNYVWFNNELWRIIGVFGNNTHGQSGDLVKIIRANPLGGLVWDKASSNNWNVASLKTLLNTNYYNGTNETTPTNCYGNAALVPGNCNFVETGITDTVSRSMIQSVVWKLGGMPTIDTAQNTYTAERSTTVYSGNATTYTGYIGLMYPSDYGFAARSTECPRTMLLSAYTGTTGCGAAYTCPNGGTLSGTTCSGQMSIIQLCWIEGVYACAVNQGCSALCGVNPNVLWCPYGLSPMGPPSGTQTGGYSTPEGGVAYYAPGATIQCAGNGSYAATCPSPLYACNGKSWLYESAYESTLMHYTSSGTITYGISINNNITTMNPSVGYNVRPTLYLKNTVKKLSGTGTYNEPYILLPN